MNIFDSPKTSRASGRPNPYRFIGLVFIISCISLTLLRHTWSSPNLITEYFLEHRRCEPGVFHSPTQLQYAVWHPDGPDGLALPMYLTQPLNATDPFIEHAVIIQHGNNRNGNDYFCGGVNSLLDTNSSIAFLRSHLIIAPQFLIDGDLCWADGTQQTVSTSQGVSCGLHVWTSEGWKDGHQAVNRSSSTNPFHSYDVFNLLIERLRDKTLFPSLRLITLFGFSAGGQTVLRYSMWPKVPPHSDSFDSNSSTSVQYVVGDVSSYLYFDARRPLINGSSGYAVPTADWLEASSWRTDASGKPWISSWNSSCSGFNNWRYGLDRLSGYYAFHAASRPDFRTDLINAFPARNMHFLIGLNDSLNCKLSAFPGCMDNDLATNCQAMLQGNNRLDRFIKWKDYLETYFHLNNTILYSYVKDITHDPVAMLASPAAKCVVFKHCPPGVYL